MVAVSRGVAVRDDRSPVDAHRPLQRDRDGGGRDRRGAVHRPLPAHAPPGRRGDARDRRPAPERRGPRGVGPHPRRQAGAHARPVIGIPVPVMPEASGLVRNRISAAASAGWTHGFGSAFGMLARFTGWSMVPGRIAFTVMPWSFVSAASASVQRSTAPFAIAEPAEMRPALSAAPAATETIRP